MDAITYPDGQRIGHVVNAADLPWLPDDTPFGNLTPKLFWVMTQLAHANQRLEESAAHWSAAMSGSIGNDLAEHKLTAGEAVFSMRRAADEFVTLIAVLEDRLETGFFPSKPRYDSVGTAFDGNGNARIELWARHAWLLQTLNDLANAQKHSFVDSDTTVVGQLQPCATALHLPYNDTEKRQVRLYVVALDHLATAYGAFLADVVAHLRAVTSSLHEPD